MMNLLLGRDPLQILHTGSRYHLPQKIQAGQNLLLLHADRPRDRLLQKLLFSLRDHLWRKIWALLLGVHNYKRE